MPTTKIAITLDEEIVEQLDQWVREGKYPTRSKAIQEAMKERMARWRKTRLIEEAVKLNPKKEEMVLAEESLAAENEIWPKYCEGRSTGRISTRFAGESRPVRGLF